MSFFCGSPQWQERKCSIYSKRQRLHSVTHIISKLSNCYMILLQALVTGKQYNHITLIAYYQIAKFFLFCPISRIGLNSKSSVADSIILKYNAHHFNVCALHCQEMSECQGYKVKASSRCPQPMSLFHTTNSLFDTRHPGVAGVRG